ncbi:uncharacterized protein [Rutidosis leptorrhynchoides]|uniref:uncharacterized protein n=1 Tax=Rutidosis leptorrhynchoides TaxID=125765 RepID=UPI003A999266
MFFNYPGEFQVVDLWKTFKPYGAVRDVYVAGNRLKGGEKYAFVRFAGVTDSDSMLRRLEGIRFDGKPIKVFKATNRKPKVDGPRINVRSRFENTNKDGERVFNHGYRDERKFNEVLGKKDNDLCYTLNQNKDDLRSRLNSKKGCKDSNQTSLDDKEFKSVFVKDEDGNDEVLQFAIVGDVINSLVLNNLETICMEEGLFDVQVKCLGGLSVMLIFKNEKSVCEVINHKNHPLSNWVHKISRWDPSLWPERRMVWLEIRGVPPQCWNEKTFLSIAEWWGVVYRLENCEITKATHLEYGRVYVKLENPGKWNPKAQASSLNDPPNTNNVSGPENKGGLKNKRIKKHTRAQHRSNEGKSISLFTQNGRSTVKGTSQSNQNGGTIDISICNDCYWGTVCN